MVNISEFINLIISRFKRKLIGELISSGRVIIDRGHTTLRINVRQKENSKEMFIALALFSSGSSSYHVIEGVSVKQFGILVQEAMETISGNGQVST